MLKLYFNWVLYDFVFVFKFIFLEVKEIMYFDLWIMWVYGFGFLNFINVYFCIYVVFKVMFKLILYKFVGIDFFVNCIEFVGLKMGV